MVTVAERLDEMARRQRLRQPQPAFLPAASPPRRRETPPLKLTKADFDQMRRAHTAAMKLLHGKGGGFIDGALLLSYVVWPTEAITEALEEAVGA